MTINVTLKEVKAEIANDVELVGAPTVMKRDAILSFVDIVENHPAFTLTSRSKDAIIKYANSLVKGESEK